LIGWFGCLVGWLVGLVWLVGCCLLVVYFKTLLQ
jgi:hypothetical protein